MGTGVPVPQGAHEDPHIRALPEVEGFQRMAEERALQENHWLSQSASKKPVHC